MARECPVELKCNECESDRLHSHASRNYPLTSGVSCETDTEQQNNSLLEVTSRCTEVCGDGLPAQTCAKICLVRVHPHDQRERSVKTYAILEDQSNRSQARSEFFQQFGIQGSLSPYLMRTCAGTTEKVGRKAVSFQIEAMKGEMC
ncbi:hypothetical protein N1851_027882 [Merluccius polli]|uniref:Uncharacterized protein n=1 Tax=Merluccius polli TaxID=89951 RepID=A0AA47M9P6_MERPO|nr:hypothetical protein N1851_027882 [Merluccius polli]